MKEIWKDITNYEGRYQISNYGRVKSLARLIKNGIQSEKYLSKEIILKQSVSNNGYKIVVLQKNNIRKHMRVHRLVGLAFIDNPDNKPQINHINGIKDDNLYINLEWCTNSENQLHANRTGLRNYKPSEEAKRKISFTHRENNKLGLNKSLKPVNMYTRESNRFVKRFVSINDAIRWLRINGYPTCKDSNISSACKRKFGYKQGRAYGYYWEYAV